MSSIPVPELPSTIFNAEASGTRPVTSETQPLYVVDDRVFPAGVEYPAEGGIVVHKLGGDLIEENGKAMLINPVPLLYPEKGFPSPERVLANNYVKAYLMGWVLVFGSPLAPIVFAGFALLPWKHKMAFVHRWLNEFKRFASMIQEAHFFANEKHYSLPCQEIKVLIEEFLLALGFGQISYGVALNLAHLLEYDQAYRYWVEDIAYVVTKEQLLNNPRKGVATMVAAFADRHPKPHIVHKFISIGRILSIVLFVPRIRQAFRTALEKTKWERIQLDEADRYHVLRFNNYKFMGIPAELRAATFAALHNGNPPKVIMVRGE